MANCVLTTIRKLMQGIFTDLHASVSPVFYYMKNFVLSMIRELTAWKNTELRACVSPVIFYAQKRTGILYLEGTL